ncbi:MAG: hydrogenase expression/formation protein HypE [Candidatus Binatia bacterium]
MAECPLPDATAATVLLGHGSGGRMTAELLRDLFLPALGNPVLNRLGDSAVFDAAGLRLAFTTDAFVVNPLRFPGGDLGSLAVHGTINDLAVAGARPLALAAAFILEEGYPLADLRGLVASPRAAAHAAEIAVVAADTKVVERGKGDGVYVASSGIGVVPSGVDLAPAHARPGDAVLVSGPVGDHGIAVLSAREGLAFSTAVVSDSAALHHLVGALLTSGAAVRCLRDPTRGGVATVVNELAVAAGAVITLDEPAVPVRPGVRAACEMLGLDPLYVACEGRLLAIVAAADAGRALAALRAHPLGADAAAIGVVSAADAGPPARLRTAFGSTRALGVLPGAQLPRIC